MNDLTADIHEKWMAALVMHTGIGDRDLGACDLALGMALGELDAAWQRNYDGLMVSADELAHDNAQLLARLQAATPSAVGVWRSNGTQPTSISAGQTHQVDQGLIAVTDAAIVVVEEADDGDRPLSLAAVADDDEEEPFFPYKWEGLSIPAMDAVGGLIDGRPWRIVVQETKREIVLQVIRELAAAQHDSAPLTIADFDRSRPLWMPTFPSLSVSLGMTWTQMRTAATQLPTV